ncbi:hypothetical protein BDN72DRAFT_847284, partial [Pluteus cervinus]
MLLSLSPELILAILEYVDEATVVRCREICSRLRDILSNDIGIQYRLELLAQNMVDCGPLSAGGMTTFARLEALKSFKYTYIPKPNGRGVVDIHNVPIFGIQGNSANNIEIRNLAEEAFQVHEQWRDCLWHETPGMVYLRRNSVLHFVRLPGPMRGIPSKKWKVDTGMNGSWGFHMDSQQDLL